MGRASESGGIDIRETSIRVRFMHQGVQRKETIYLDNDPLPPTPPNVKYAKRLALEIKSHIRNGTFDYATYFPHSPMAKRIDASENAKVIMLHDVMDSWLGLIEVKASTKRQYTTRIKSFWKLNLADMPIAAVKYSDILTALAAGTWRSGKSRNNELSMIKQVFEFAKRDKLIEDNPCQDVERATYQRPKPDPFSLGEADAIIDVISTKHPEQLRNFVEFMFFTGLRTNEGIGLRWSDIDLTRNEMKITGGIVCDEETDTTKTGVERTVRLNSRAQAALQRQKAHTYLAAKSVFHDPATGDTWGYAKLTDVRTFWESALKLAKTRYRRPYNMRHTYAAIGLMSGANPAFLAKQLGHSLEMFFGVYADWINGGADDREMEKIEAGLREKSLVNPTLTLSDSSESDRKQKSL